MSYRSEAKKRPRLCDRIIIGETLRQGADYLLLESSMDDEPMTVDEE